MDKYSRLKTSPQPPEFLAQKLDAVEEFLREQSDVVLQKIQALFQRKNLSMDLVENAAIKTLLFPIFFAEYGVDCIETICPSVVEKIAKMLMSNDLKNEVEKPVQNDSIQSVSMVALIKRFVLQRLPLPCLVRDNGTVSAEYADAVVSLPNIATADLTIEDLLPKNVIIGRNDGHYYQLVIGKIGEKAQRVRVTDEEARLLRLDALRCFEKMEKSMPWYKRWMQEFVNSIS